LFSLNKEISIGERAEMKQAVVRKSPFIGRQHEIAGLQEALDQARAGQSRVVMLAGAPGIGKTRTAQEFSEHAARHATLVLWGRCPEEAGAPPYWPWLQAIRSFAERQDDETLRAALGIAASHIAELDPELARRLPNLAPTPPSADAAQARFRLFDAIASFWRHAAAERTMLVVLDDLHRADTASLRLLDFVSAELGTSRLLIIGTYRDSEITREHPLSGTLAELARHASFQRLRLTGFSESETRDFIHAIGGVSASQYAATLHEMTEGHPFFLTEMTRYLAAGGGARPIPEGIREVIGSRLNRLTPLCNRVLGNAAVIGRGFGLDVLIRLLDEISEDQCLDTLEEALGARVIEQLAEPGAYQFTHALIRETLYDEMPAPRRIRLHQRVGAALEARCANDLTPCLSALAYHYEAARPVGTGGKAVEYATRAAERADALLAFEEAARLYQVSLRAIAPGMETKQCELLLALGEVQNKAGDSANALTTFESAAETARRLRSAQFFARAALGYENVVWRIGTGAPRALALVEGALKFLDTADSAQRAALLSASCRALIFCDRLDQAEAAHHEAVAMARRLDDPIALFGALSAIVPARWWYKLEQIGLAAGREAIELANKLGHPEWAVGYVTGWHIGGLLEIGDVAGATATAKFHLETAETMRQPFLQAVGLGSLAMLAIHEGRFAEGEQLAQQANAAGARFDSGNASGVFSVQMFTLRREQGRLRELAPVFERFRDMVPERAIWQPGLAILYCELGRNDEARAVFEALAAKNFAGIPHDGIWLGSIAYLAETCVWLGDAASAAVLYDLFAPYAGRNIMFGNNVASFGAAARVLGMLATTLERWDRAEQHFQTALALDTATGGRPWLAHTQYEYAAMLLNRKRDADAARATLLVERALTMSRALGMRALAERLFALEQHLRAGPARETYPAGLTEREVQVLRLIAVGKSNQDIARLLFRSVNTVANHVRNILTKTNTANRTEAAAFALQYGLLKR